ncbi:hypothetical protein FRC04_008132 [Tulasnella sp. 424]|nr:hypothetical protein FRC04_008132 [Tulasnella sp. 424]KAG8974789.1 hypothetical protein FRC05_006950 [Tulasnella sp. 425]
MASAWSALSSTAPYTDNPLLPPGTIFPSHSWQLLSSAVTLIEKVYVVWAPHGTARPSRLKNHVYCLCCALLIPLVVIIIVLIFGRIAHLRDADRVCVIGLRKGASLSLLCYDLAMTAILTTLFVYPLFRSKVSPRLRRVASRTLIASTAALVTSCANIAVLTVLHGQELGWVCLSSCGVDVTINALAIYVVSSPGRKEANSNNNNAAQNAPSSNRPTSSADEQRVPANGTPKPPPKFAKASSLRQHKYEEDMEKAVTKAVPASILAGRVLPRAPDNDDGEHSTKQQGERRVADNRTVKIESPEPRRKSGTFWNGLASALPFGHKIPSSEDQHTMSVQVTVTTEHQIVQPDADEIELTDSDLTLSNTDEKSPDRSV